MFFSIAWIIWLLAGAYAISKKGEVTKVGYIITWVSLMFCLSLQLLK